MRARGILAAVATCAAIAAMSLEGATNASDAMRPDVSLSATAAVAGGRLSIEYVLTNRGDKTIYVFDRPARFDAGAVTVDTDRMFVLLSGPDEARLLHAFVGLPALHDVRRRPPILASTVAPRGEHRRKVTLDLPLSENQQFYSAQPTADPPLTVARLRIQVGWVESRPGMNVTTLSVGGKEEVQLAGGWGRPTQWISESVIALPGVAVLRHAEPFEREPTLD